MSNGEWAMTATVWYETFDARYADGEGVFIRRSSHGRLQCYAGKTMRSVGEDFLGRCYAMF